MKSRVAVARASPRPALLALALAATLLLLASPAAASNVRLSRRDPPLHARLMADPDH